MESTKSERILNAFARAKKPITRIQALKDVRDFEERDGVRVRAPSFRPTSNRCYFRPNTQWNRESKGEERYSLLVRNLIEVAGKTKTGELTYRLVRRCTCGSGECDLLQNHSYWCNLVKIFGSTGDAHMR